MPAPLRSSDPTPPGAATVARPVARRLAFVAVALVAVGCGGGDVDLEVVDPVISDAGGLASVYLRIVNRGDVSDELLSVSVEGSSETMLHVTQIDDSGVATMAPAGTLRIDAGAELVLEPGGLHVMVMVPPPLERGGTVAITLSFAETGDIETTARVIDPAEAGGGS